MLVLSRKRGEVVVIGGNIQVTVLEVHGDRVKLGLCGPAEVPFRREEVCRRIASKEPLCHAGCA
jgi:carbon storage regulator